MKARTATYILLLTIASALPSGLHAQQPQTAAQQPAYPAAQQGKTDTKGMTVLMPGETPKPTKYVEVKEQEQHLVFFQGFNISADVYGPAAYALSDYGWAEGALRLNLKNTFFPIVEIGYAKCEKADVNTSITYNVSAPYGRIGVDINMLKNKFQDNRLYLGARYGISKFKYDMSGPAISDPVWVGSEPYDIKGIDSACKVAILANAVFKKDVTIRDVTINGIDTITDGAISLAKDHDMVIRLIGEVSKDKLDVSPRLIPKGHPLSITGTLNTAVIQTDFAGPITVSGRGAGKNETASAILGDLIFILEARKK